MHRLLARQIKAASLAGVLDVERLLAMVDRAYTEADSDGRRAEESITGMIEEVARLDRKLREREALRFQAALDSMVHGFSMFDEEWRLIACNRKYAEFYDMPEELTRPGTPFADILAHRLGNGTIPEDIHARLVDSFSRDLVRETRVHTYRIADGRTLQVTQSPMAAGGIVSVHQDITEDVARLQNLKTNQAELARQNLRFEAAVNNIGQGLCMFDAGARLVICNDAYVRLYDLPPELSVPGASFDAILKHRFERGMAPASGAAAYTASRYAVIERQAAQRDVFELEDGRSILICHQPMADGGWVATHEDITEQRQKEARIRHLARHDALTDLPNRRLFHEELDKGIARARRGETVAVLCVDLDHFKAINDTQGHAVGDEVLVAVAQRLRDAARGSDTVARIGGDEFSLLLTGLGSPADAAAVASRIVSALARPIEALGHSVTIGGSVGIAVAPADGLDAEALLSKADLALYRAKQEGRGNYHFFEQEMDEALQRRRSLEHALRQALGRNEFRLVYQPLIRIETGRISAFEALVRWDHPEKGTINAAEFIPIAEETGTIVALGEWVLRQACLEAAGWPEDIRITVNLSAVQFRNRAMVAQVASALRESGLPPARLELEITETLLLNDAELTLGTLRQLRGLGVRISMDDFGTGYSSLNYLRSFPFDRIKLDRSFLEGLTPAENNVAIIRAVIGLGRSLGMATAAEGIETDEQLAAVRMQGCDEVQGFLFSPPLPASAARALIGTAVEQPELLRA